MADQRFLHFIEAQEGTYEQAFAELQKGRKSSHWMWFIFPQLEGLGASAMSKRYAIRDLADAGRYLEHDILGKRLIEISKLVLAVNDKTANQIFGSPDDMKLRSSMTLFSLVPGADPVFGEVLDKFYGGWRDPRTLSMVNPEL